jgi:hypothetical protein
MRTVGPFDRRQLHRLVGELRNGSVCGMHAVPVDVVLNAALVIECLWATVDELQNKLAEAALIRPKSDAKDAIPPGPEGATAKERPGRSKNKENARFDQAVGRTANAVVAALAKADVLAAVDDAGRDTARSVVRSSIEPMLWHQFNRGDTLGFSRGRRDGQRLIADFANAIR